ncbi:MAG: SdpI family protein [Oscillospiraceae bacterium]|nr:SdpI family protein [Oscillospiraceae bacterium]
MRRKKIIYYMMRKAPHLLLLVAMFAASLLVGIFLPQRIPLHWDGQGIADRFGTKYELILLLPCAAVIIFAVGVFAESRIILPSHKLRGLMSFMQFFFLLLFFVVQARNLLRAENIWVPIERFMTIPALLLYMYVASMLHGAEYLSLFGIKTKWTMGSQAVWEKTNRLASRLFRLSAVLMLIPMYFYNLFYIFLAAPPVLSFVTAAVYSILISNNSGQ